MVLKPVLWQVPAILLASIVLGLGVNHFRPGGLELARDWRTVAVAEKTAQGLPVISLDDAAQLHRESQAVFIDARPQAAYAEGHIRGAVSLPWHRAEEQFIDVLPDIPTEQTVITYCDGVSCELSDHLAEFLVDLGYTNVHILPDGWGRWKEKGLPTARN